MLIDLPKQHLLIRDAAPRRVPSVGDDDIDLSIARQQLCQLILDELYLRRSHVEMADIVAQRQNRIVKTPPQAGLAERIHVGANDVGRIRCPANACRLCFWRPYTEAILVAGRQTPPSP